MAWLIPQRLLQTPDAQIAAVDGRDVTLHVPGLVCALCARRVAASLNQLDGVEAASCDLDSGSAVVRLNGGIDDVLNGETLRAAVLRAAIAMPLRRTIARIAGADQKAGV